jgi:hypothetical protein
MLQRGLDGVSAFARRRRPAFAVVGVAIHGPFLSSVFTSIGSSADERKWPPMTVARRVLPAVGIVGLSAVPLVLSSGSGGSGSDTVVGVDHPWVHGCGSDGAGRDLRGVDHRAGSGGPG